MPYKIKTFTQKAQSTSRLPPDPHKADPFRFWTGPGHLYCSKGSVNPFPGAVGRSDRRNGGTVAGRG